MVNDSFHRFASLHHLGLQAAGEIEYKDPILKRDTQNRANDQGEGLWPQSTTSAILSLVTSTKQNGTTMFQFSSVNLKIEAV